MPRRNLLWQLIGSFCLILLAGLTLVTSFSLHTIHDLHDGQTAQTLTASARLMASQMPGGPPAEHKEEYQRLVNSYGALTGTRFTIIDEDGNVLADTEEDPAFIEETG